MTTQPEALWLADRLISTNAHPWDNIEAAAELRRLHEVNQELLEALKEAADALETASNDGGVNFYQYAKEARAVINKATGEQA